MADGFSTGDSAASFFVATLPDPRVAALIQAEADGAQFEHLCRVPYWPYWGPLLTVLHAHRTDVIRLAPINGANMFAVAQGDAARTESRPADAVAA